MLRILINQSLYVRVKLMHDRWWPINLALLLHPKPDDAANCDVPQRDVVCAADIKIIQGF